MSSVDLRRCGPADSSRDAGSASPNFVPPAGAWGQGTRMSVDGTDRTWVYLRRQTCFYGYSWQFISAKVFILRGFHFGHGGVRFAVIVGGVPEQEADAAFFFGRGYLHFDVLGRIGLGAPAEGLQPRADCYSTACCDQREALHGFADEVLGGVARVGDVIHAEEVRGIDHGREYVAVFRHADDILSGMREIDGALPGHHAEDIERE